MFSSHRSFRRLCAFALAAAALATAAQAAPRNRVAGRVDTARVRRLQGNVHRLAQPGSDLGPVDAAMSMQYMMVLFKPSAAQQTELDQLLVDQQNPSSANFHKWLTPEEFGNRFGLSASDHSKVAAWLTEQGFAIDHHARSSNWIAFSGTAGQVEKALNAPIHYFQAEGKKHFANTVSPAVPEALADVISGFAGLHDFKLRSNAIKTDPDYNSGTSHYLAPEDWTTIYNVTPLASAGLDGKGQGIVIVGQSDPVLSDLRAFKTRFNLPQNDPKFLLYGGVDPGVDSNILVETNLDLEWAGAIAPQATLYYVFGQNAFEAIVASVESNLAPIISVSYGGCEVDGADPGFRSVFQQANAQGTTILASSGDSGAASCDLFNSQSFATHGPTVSIPNVFPEVTSVGGTQFADTTGNYWSATNSKNSGSALSYIPEAAWNETSPRNGLTSTGGGASAIYTRPLWQKGPGLPNDNVRYVPDISFSAALHDSYLVIYGGSLIAVGGTSASTPSFAGLVALLGQYQINKGFQTQPGLGNINPQLYRLAQSAPSVFHDTTTGDNIVPCLQATPGCLNGSFGYKATPGYDFATGLGSVDANALVTQWNTSAASVSVRLGLSTARVDINGSVTATAYITTKAVGTPTGTVDFSLSGIALGTVPVDTTTGSATISFLPYIAQGTGAGLVSAVYSGDASFSSGGATARLQITAPSGAAGIIVSSPTSVSPNPENAQGPSWETDFAVSEISGIPALVTAFSIDGQAQPLDKYFPAPAIPPGGTIVAKVVFFNLQAPVTRKFNVTGIDSLGHTWSRDFSIQYLPQGSFFDFLMTATPLNPVKNTDPTCPWPVQLTVTDISGNGPDIFSQLQVGGVDMTAQIPAIFGTLRLNPYASLHGTVCLSGITPPSSQPIFIFMNSGAFNEITVSFQPAPATPVTLTPTPAAIGLSAADAKTPAKATLTLDISDKTQPWSISVTPNNRTSSWLTVSPSSGVGPASITVTGSPVGLAPGAYGANLVIESPNVSQAVTVPVMLVNGGDASMTITGVANPASHLVGASPGSLVEIFGTKLANSTGVQNPTNDYLPLVADGVSATVNGYPAYLTYISAGQINLQIPYEIGSGPAVVGINNNGKIAGFQFTVTPSSPGVFTNDAHMILPITPVKAGQQGVLYFTGAGEVSPLIKSGFSPTTASLTNNPPVPQLPISVTIGGVPAFITSLRMTGSPGVAQLNFVVPKTVAPGRQGISVTVNGVTSQQAVLDVLAP
jgi:uncharacterized protein (TIGR03437 family)